MSNYLLSIQIILLLTGPAGLKGINLLLIVVVLTFCDVKSVAAIK